VDSAPLCALAGSCGGNRGDHLTVFAQFLGSSRVLKTMGIVVVAAVAESVAGLVIAAITVTRAAYQFGRQGRKSIVLALRPAVFDRDILALSVSGFFQALPEGGHTEVADAADPAPRNPITGIAGCCARAADDQAAMPPSSVMNSRRLIASPEPAPTLADYQGNWGWSVCTAAIQSRACLRWVKSVGSTRPTSSRHVRCASDSDRIGDSRQPVAWCHNRTHAVQQTFTLIRSPRRRGRVEAARP
jgi:hypothetical protein